jgi:hypothetical protein
MSRPANAWRPGRELDPRVAWLLMMLYPRAWRERYGAEVLRLTRELIAAGETTPVRAAINLACAAIAERCRVLGSSWRPAMAVAAAALVAVAGGLYAIGPARHASPASPVNRVRPVSAAPAPAGLTGLLCSFSRPTSPSAAPGRDTSTTITVAGVVPAGLVFTLVRPAGSNRAAIRRLLIPVTFALPGRAASRECVELPARCRIGTGYAVNVTPGRPVVRVTIKPARCVSR